MDWDFGLSPESEAQVELIDGLAEVRKHGVEETDLSNVEVAVAFQTFAIGLLSTADVDGPEQSSADEHSCPVCDAVIEDIDAMGLSADVKCLPCECIVPSHELSEELLLG